MTKMRGSKTRQQENVPGEQPDLVEGRNAVIELLRANTTIDKLFLLDGCHDGPVETIRREIKKTDALVRYVSKERLDQMSPTGHHQGVIAYTAACRYGTVEDILGKAKERNEKPFIFLLDNIEDPHNLGAIIRTAEASGAHGVVIPKTRAAQLTAAAFRASAGAAAHLTVARVTNLARTIEDLKKEGLWFVLADAKGIPMYDLDLTGALGVVIGNEGKGAGTLVRSKCDMVASIPLKGEISSLNASVAAGVLAYEIVRQRVRGR